MSGSRRGQKEEKSYHGRIVSSDDEDEDEDDDDGDGEIKSFQESSARSLDIDFDLEIFWLPFSFSKEINRVRERTTLRMNTA